MTGDKITLAEAQRRLREDHEIKTRRFQEAREEAVPKMAADLGVPVNRFRSAFAPHLARQIATMEEMHRLALTDLDVMSEPAPRDED